MKSVFLLPVLSLLAVSAVAAEGADPTRPPAAWLNPADPATGSPEGTGGLRLQSVLIPQHGRPVAVIGGQTVAVGGMVGGAKLIRLSEREAVLQGADGVTRLYLTPGVEKQMIATPESAKKRGKTGKEKGKP